MRTFRSHIDQEKVMTMVEKKVIEGKTVYLYSETEHRKAVEYENLSHKAIQVLEKFVGER